MEKTGKQPPAMRVRDMTQGDPIRLILAFAAPLLVGNIFQQIYTMVDTMVVGHSLGDSAVAAVGAASSLYTLLVDFVIGMNLGYGIVVTQSFGARDETALRRSVAGMAVLNVTVTSLVTALSLSFLPALLRYMNTPESIFSQVHTYIAILCAGMLTTVCYNMGAAILRAVGNSRSPLYFLMISCGINIALDVILVIGFRLGVAGAAVATVAAQGVSAILCGLYIVRNYRAILPRREDFRQIRPLLSDLLSTGFAMALTFCVVDLGSTIFQRANNLLGEAYITAYTAARRIMMIMMQPMDSIDAANATFVGQNWGAKQTGRIKAALKKVIGLDLLWSVFACGVAWLFGRALVRFATGITTAATVENAALSLRIHLSFFPALAVLFCLRTTMQAMGRKTVPVISSCIELAMKVLAARLLIPRLGFLGTCVTEPATWVLMMVFLATAFLTQGGMWRGQDPGKEGMSAN